MSDTKAFKTTEWIIEEVFTPKFLLLVILPIIGIALFYSLSLIAKVNEAEVLYQTLNGITLFSFVLLLSRLSVKIFDTKLEEVEHYTFQRTFDFFGKKRKGLVNLLLILGIITILLKIFLSSLGFTKNLPLILLGAMGAVLGVKLIEFVLNDFYKSAWRYFKYFYPSALSLAFLAFVVVRQEQFEAFFINLIANPLNLGLFFLFFTVAITTTWFNPSYLYFTDDYFNKYPPHREAAKDDEPPSIVLRAFLVFSQAIPWLYFKIRRLIFKRKLDYVYDLIWKHKAYVLCNLKYKREPAGFTLSRLFLGVAYISTLATLVFTVWLKANGIRLEILRPISPMTCFLLPLLFHYFYSYRFSKKEDKWKSEEKTAKKSKQIANSWRITMYTFTFGLVLLLVLSFINYNSYQGMYVNVTLLIFVLFTISTVIFLTLLGFTLPRIGSTVEDLPHDQTVSPCKPKRKHELYDRWFISIILGLNFTIAFMAFCCLLLILIPSFKSTYPIIEKISAINFYLLLINGFIAIFSIVDRFYQIKFKIKRQFHKGKMTLLVKPSARTWGIAIAILSVGLYFYNKGNQYHEIPYTSYDYVGGSEQVEDRSKSLEVYTAEFLDRYKASRAKDTTIDKPILLIASDGGGLKAAYWTLLVLWELDKAGIYDDQVFMMAGASGGSLGEGLYSLLKAQALENGATLDDLKVIIDKIGDLNLIAGDLAGLLTRWPMGFIPNNTLDVARRQDRMEAMAEYYFDIIQEEFGDKADPKWSYRNMRKQPYHYLWAETNYQLPVFITNTSRSEDGVKGWSHPLNNDPFLTTGVVDLTRYPHFIEEGKKETDYISFQDALFLTNRFPILSPAGKLTGKGYFIDAGALDNSGMGTLLQVLHKMKNPADSSHFDEFFEYPIKLITIRNDRSRFIEDKFDNNSEPYLGVPYHISEIGANAGAVISSGITGAPKVFDEITSRGEAKTNIPIDTLLRIDLPFRLNKEMIENYFSRKIATHRWDEIQEGIDTINNKIENAYPGQLVVEPPLGRLLAKPSQEYMNKMLKYKDVVQTINSINQEN